MEIQTPITKREIKALMQDHTGRMKKNILKFIQRKKINYSQLGAMIDKDRFYIDYIMNHPRPNPTTENILRIAAALGVPYTALFRK